MTTTAAARPAAPQPASTIRGLGLGKYREIIIAVAFFLLFDLGVLVLNFYTSFQIGQDAVGINLSGRQRMLSQRTAKALLAFEGATVRNEPTIAELDELRTAVKLFDTTLKGFQTGATVPGGDGKPVFLAAAEGDRAADILARAQSIWTPYQERLAPVLAGQPSPNDLNAAVTYARANNLKLLGLMNDLTSALEAVASQRANTLRMVQTGGIVLALLNFAFILFKFLRRLRTSDALVEAANEENREILTSVREGLFLITPEFQLGSQLSESVHQMFGRKVQPGEDFFALLQPLVSGKDLEDARGYVELLFAPHVKEALVQGINPLSEVAITLRGRRGQDEAHYLSFQFNRVHQEGGGIRHLLVTVQDVTERMSLQAQIQQDRQRAQHEFAMLLKAFNAEPGMLRQFVQRAEGHLLEVNDILRSTSAAQSEPAIVKAIDNAARRVHALKGDAAMLGLDSLTSQAHQFESELQRIRHSGGSSSALGDAMLALPMQLEDLLGKVASLKNLADMRREAGGHDALGGRSINEAVSDLAQQVAQDSGKRVAPTVRLGAVTDLPPHRQDLVREVAVQLVRNAVAHGIESPASRQASGKPAEGQIQVVLSPHDSEWQLTVRDDGAGIGAARVRQKLLELGWYDEVQLDSFSERQLMEQIFKPGFSTATELSLHAGRGAGLDVVMAAVQQLGGRLRLTSTPGVFTEFRIRFDA